MNVFHICLCADIYCKLLESSHFRLGSTTEHSSLSDFLQTCKITDRLPGHYLVDELHLMCFLPCFIFRLEGMFVLVDCGSNWIAWLLTVCGLADEKMAVSAA